MEHIPRLETPQDLERLDGQRVLVVGIYRPTRVTKRPRPDGEQRPPPRTVAVTTTGGVMLMLEIYYRQEALRPADEIDRFTGQRVRVVGTAHRRTPDQVTATGIPMATMTGPYLEVDSIEAESEAARP